MQATFPSQPVALKRMLFDHTDSPKRWWRFVLEVEANGTVFVNNHSVSSRSQPVWKGKKCNSELGEVLKNTILHRCLSAYSAGASGPGAGKRIVMGGDWNFHTVADATRVLEQVGGGWDQISNDFCHDKKQDDFLVTRGWKSVLDESIAPSDRFILPRATQRATATTAATATFQRWCPSACCCCCWCC